MHTEVASEKRVNIHIEQILRIVRRYNNPEYLVNADSKSDIFHGGIFVYEILKSGIREELLRVLFDSHKTSLNAEANSVLDEIVNKGIAEFYEAVVTTK